MCTNVQSKVVRTDNHPCSEDRDDGDDDFTC